VIRVVFETHATSVDNERGIATGWLPGELSDTGRTQAAQLGVRRRHDGIDLVVCSDLRRAVETVELAFAGSTLPIRYDARLRECNYGDWNGMPRARLEAERLARIDVPFPGGESWREAVQRHAGFLGELATERNAGRVLLVGHVATRWALDHLLDSVPLEHLAAETFLWQEGWEYELETLNPNGERPWA
jgi:2,3-bisphosphoglycerate-dependent phosphoglycerate mutase